MSRNGSGVYSLPQPPFVPSTPILSAAVNSDLSDIANALTGSIASDGQTVISGALKGYAGSEALPGYSFSTDLDTGMWRSGTNTLAWSANAAKQMELSPTIFTVTPDAVFSADVSVGVDLSVTGNLAVTGTATIGGRSIVPITATPQGRLTLTSGTPVLTTDVTAASTVYYTPYVGNFLPIYDGTNFVNVEFSEMSFAMSGANFAAGAIYDIFAAYDSTTLRIGIGPAWSTPTPGSGARGTGAGTTQLARLQGILTNAVSITLRYASGSTFIAPANHATYLGSIWIDATNSQVSYTLASGQNRKIGLWNGYNRVLVIMQSADPTSNWQYSVANTWRASNNAPSSYSAASFNYGSGTTTNSVTTFCGLAEEEVFLEFNQRTSHATGDGSVTTYTAIGLNSVSSPTGSCISGRVSNTIAGSGNNNDGMQLSQRVLLPAIGLNNLISLEYCEKTGSTSAFPFFYGTNSGAAPFMMFSARYRA